jgi:hypothetical protein
MDATEQTSLVLQVTQERQRKSAIVKSRISSTLVMTLMPGLLSLVLSGCATSAAESKDIKSLDGQACSKWVEDYNATVFAFGSVSDPTEGTALLLEISEKEAATSELAEDPELKQLLADKSANDAIFAADNANGTVSETLPVTDADIYKKCKALGFATEPKNADGSYADFYSAEPASGAAPSADPGLSDRALAAVHDTYFDCFPAVAHQTTITEYLTNMPDVSSDVFTQSFSASSANSGEGVVTVSAGKTVLQFQTTDDGSGNITVVAYNDETASALQSAECVAH